MVTLHEDLAESLLIAQPNRSASWQLNKLIIAAFAAWWSLIAGFFVFRGLWPIAPFAGLEVLGLATALYYVCWKLQQRHVFRFSQQQLILQKGAYYPRFTWQFTREAISLSVEVQAHPWDPLKIFLCSRDQQIPIGNFLSKDDSKKLLTLLRAQGVPVRNYSESTRIDI
ncbi:MAG: hypothetical protein JWM78_646 [Verrucomicrobiaceae bacterium]|nr:hypothetical protein [Verrucomicrobiaceae bacterium]